VIRLALAETPNARGIYRRWALCGMSMMLAGHTNLRTTQRYIEANRKAQMKIVELV